MKARMAGMGALALALALAMGGCGGGGTTGSPSPAPFNPVGTYVGQTSAQGQALTMTLEITGEPGSYSGVLRPGADLPDVPLTSVQVEGRTITARGNIMGEGLEVAITVEGNDFSGSWSAAGMTGALVGTRR